MENNNNDNRVVRISSTSPVIHEHGNFETVWPPAHTFGQVVGQTTVTGKPVHDPYAMSSLRVLPQSHQDTAQVVTDLEEAQEKIRIWKNDKLVFIGWSACNIFFGFLYILFLEGLYLALGGGIVFPFIATAMYLSPWFKSQDGVFAIFAFIVASFVSDFFFAFLTLVFGLNDSTVLACGGLILCHGSLAFMLFRRHQGVLDAMDIVAKSQAARAQTTSTSFEYRP